MKNVDKAKAAWDDNPPDWIIALAEACDTESGAKVARKIGYSSSYVSQAIRNIFPGDIEAMEGAVRGALMHSTVQCPVLGQLEHHRCLKHQRQPYANTNAIRVRLYKKCRNGCLHSRINSPSKEA